MQPLPVPRSRIVGASSLAIASSPSSTNCSVSRARHQHRPVQHEIEPVEFLVPEDARHRLASKPSLGKGVKPGHRFAAGAAVVSAIDSASEIEIEGRFRQQSGIELGRIDIAAAETVAHGTPGGANRKRRRRDARRFRRFWGGLRGNQEMPSISARRLAWFSAINASTNSSSASPATTLSSL